jgi:hypothetical protein
MQLPALDFSTTIALIAALSAAASYGTTYILRQFIHGWVAAAPNRSKPWYFRALLRTCACVVGGAFGYLLMRDATGLSIGFSAGAMNTFLVMKVKERIERKTREDQ